MLLFLHGEDTFRSTKKLKEIIRKYEEKNKKGVNVFNFDLEEKGFEELRDQLRSRSIFNEKRLVILKNPFSNSEFKKKLAKNKNILKTSDVIVFHEKGSVPKKDKLAKILVKEGESQEFKLLKGSNLKKWIKKLARSYWADVDSSALNLLANRFGNDLWRLDNELAKIANWKNASSKNKVLITRKDVEKLTRPRLENDIFKTINAVADKKRGEALSMLHSHLKEGDSPLYLLSMLGWQFTRLLAVKEKEEEGENPYDLSWHPYVVKKSKRLTPKFKFEALKEIHNKVLETDLKIKTGRIEPELGLELLVAEI